MPISFKIKCKYCDKPVARCMNIKSATCFSCKKERTRIVARRNKVVLKTITVEEYANRYL